MDRTFYSVALSLVPGVGGFLYKRLIEHFERAEAVFQATLQELLDINDIGVKTAHAIKNFNQKELVEENIYLNKRTGARILVLEDEDYPVNLRNITNPPPVLYVKGDLRDCDRYAMAIVGSRTPSRYGELMAESISRNLADEGVTIVSGMARGIDSICHRETLRAGGRTIAVLGSGIDVIYPPENRGLFDRIIQNGAVITEFPQSTPPDGTNFPHRNRIISGLTLGVVVVEAGMKSGSLISAELAAKQGREVFAVPGRVGSPESVGTNKLIKNGAYLLENVKDIIDIITPRFRTAEKSTPQAQTERALSKSSEIILDALIEKPLHIDDIVTKTNLHINEVSSILVHLEIGGFVTQMPGKLFICNNS